MSGPADPPSRPLDLTGKKVEAPKPAPPQSKHVRGSIWAGADGKLQTRNYTPGSGK